METDTPMTNGEGTDSAVKRVATGEKVWCKCDRCGDFQPLFQYTKYEVMWISYVENGGKDRNGDIRRIAKRTDIGEKRGLCKECALFVNKQRYDTRSTTNESNPQTETGAQT